MKNFIIGAVTATVGSIVVFSLGVFGGIKYMAENFDVGLKDETKNDSDVLYVRQFLRKYTTME